MKKYFVSWDTGGDIMSICGHDILNEEQLDGLKKKVGTWKESRKRIRFVIPYDGFDFDLDPDEVMEILRDAKPISDDEIETLKKFHIAGDWNVNVLDEFDAWFEDYFGED